MSVIDHYLIRGMSTSIPEQRFDWDGSGNLIYQGWAHKRNVATSAAQWMVAKLTYNGSNQITRIQVLENIVWDNRTTAF